MSTFNILLNHSESGDTVVPEQVNVEDGDTLHFAAQNAQFIITPFFSTGDYDQNSITVTPQAPVDLEVRTTPADADIFGINCQGIHYYDADSDSPQIPIPPGQTTPAKIIIVKAGLEENVLRNKLVAKLTRVQNLINSFYEFKEHIL
ncbi:MAG: hypothetical protein IPM56_06390 [Ignavibacteriales bacterium]|nr:MAG: hypothetical protein IPM56_06390 [Ignavibacteriales bacterium]